MTALIPELAAEHAAGPEGSPHYRLEDTEIALLSSQVLHDLPPTTDKDSRFLTYRFAGISPYANLGRHIERQVFQEAFGNDETTMEAGYGPYEAASTFFVTFDRQTCAPVGALRIIEHTEDVGLKTLKDLASGEVTDLVGNVVSLSEDEFMRAHGITNLKDCWDVGTVAVLPDYRLTNMAVGIRLYRALYKSALDNKLEHFISVIDKKPHRELTRTLGIPFVPLAGLAPVNYMGSENSHVVYGKVTEFYEKMNQHRSRYRDSVLGRLALPYLDGLMDGDGIDHTLMFS